MGRDPGSEQTLSEDEDEALWVPKLRSAYHTLNFSVVSRIMVSMVSAGSPGEQRMLSVLAQECLRGGVGRFSALLAHLNDSSVSPRLTVELWRLLESWFRGQCPTVVHWHTVVHAFTLADELEEALDLIRAMELGEDERLPEPTLETYSVLLRSIGTNKGVLSATSLFNRMSMQGLRTNCLITYLLMTVVSARAEPPDFEGAKRWLRKAEERLDQSAYVFKMDYFYNTLMAAYIRAGRLKDAFTLLGCIRNKGVKPGGTTFQILMHGCMRSSAFGIEECRLLLRVMEQMGLPPETSHYNILLRGYSMSGQLTSALKLAKQMREANLQWDNFTYLFLLNAVVGAGQVELSLRLLARMRQDGLRPRSQHYQVAFVGLVREGYYEDAARIFRKLESQKELINPVAYNLMIAMECQRGCFADALEVRNRMEQRGIATSVMTFCVLVRAYTAEQLWGDVLALQAPVSALRARLEALVRNPVAEFAAREAAKQELQDEVQVRYWTEVYYTMIDAAVWKSEWLRAVQLVEEMVGYGLEADPSKHSRLLVDARESVRLSALSSPAFAKPQAPPEDKQSRAAQESWVQRTQEALYNPTLGSTLGMPGSSMAPRPPNGSSIRAVADPRKQSTPPHVLVASLSPEWIDGMIPGQPRDTRRLLVQCLGGGPVPGKDAYCIVHDYHHATVQHRAMLDIRMRPGQAMVCRVAAESRDSVQQLFSAFGWPGDNGSPVYVFLRPAAAALDALLAILAAGTLAPSEVIILRCEDAAGLEAIQQECQVRDDRPLSMSLNSVLAGLPVAVTVNSRLLLTNVSDVVLPSPSDFEEALRAALNVLGPQLSFLEGNGDMAWQTWLRRQGLRQVIRCDLKGIRLDGVLHKSTRSRADLFRLRGLDDGQVAVDVWLDQQGSVTEFLGG